MVAIHAGVREGVDLRLIDVCFGSKGDICAAPAHVRFTPNSERESRHAAMEMSALPGKRTCAAQEVMSAKGQ